MTVQHLSPHVLDAAVRVLQPDVPGLTPAALSAALREFPRAKNALPEKALTRRETADVLHVSISTINRMLKAGKLKASRVNFRSVAWYPTILNSLLESLALTLTNNHVETIVAEVASLTRTLYTITNHCDSLVLQNLTSLLEWEFFTCHYLFDNATKIHFCHFAFCLIVQG